MNAFKSFYQISNITHRTVVTKIENGSENKNAQPALPPPVRANMAA